MTTIACAKCLTALYPEIARPTDDGYVHADGLACHRADLQRRAAERAEDAAFLADTGESLTGAAERLGMTVSALSNLLRKQGMRDVLVKLTTREPFYEDRPPQRRAS